MADLVLFLDDGGVLSDNAVRGAQWQRLVGEFFAPRLGGSPAAWAAANRTFTDGLFEPAAWARRLAAAPDYRAFDETYQHDWLHGMCAILGVPPPREEVCQALAREASAFITPQIRAAIPGAADSVRALHRAGYPLHTASGEDSPELANYLTGMGVCACFQRLYGPDLIDTLKAGPAFYARLFADAGIAPATALVVDDSPQAVRWAAAVGARTVLVRNDVPLPPPPCTSPAWPSCRRFSRRSTEMAWNATPYTLPLLGTAIICIILAVSVWRRRPVPGAVPATLLLLAAAEWAIAYALEFASPGLADKTIAAQVQYIGIATLPTAWFAFAMQYTGRGHWLTRRTLALLCAEPLLLVALVWTNALHSLIWRRVDLDTSSAFPVFSPSYGSGFWANTVYDYLLLGGGAFLIIRALIRTPQLYQRQAGALLIACALPWISNVIYLARVSPFPGLDLTPVSFAGTGIALTVALWQLRLLDLIPVARSTILENMQDGVLVIDAQNRIVDLNPAAARAIGRPARTVIGQPAALALTAWQDLREQYRDVRDARFEVQMGTGAAQRAFDVQITPLYEGREHFLGRLVVWRDVTAHKQAEAQLYAAKEAAEAAARAKSAFLANISHELRTPLNAIVGFTEMIHEDLEPTEHQASLADLERVQAAARQLLGLIEEILDLSKIEAGNMEIEDNLVPLAALITAVAAVARPWADKNGNRLVVEVPPDLGVITTDGAKLRQVLLNLLSNAAKFTSEGMIILRVAREPPGLHFAVSDTGIGLDPAQLPTLFQPFTQADASTTRKYGGAGLGLALSRQLCDLLGGEIRVDSRPGAGATFTVVLPVAEQPMVPIKEPAGQEIAAL